MSSSPLRLVRAAPATPYTFTFDGRTLTALPGQTLAAALWAAGILSWRTTRHSGAPRGAFCGIGVCHDCLATVNGRPNQRACLVAVQDGDVVTTQAGTGHAGLAEGTGAGGAGACGDGQAQKADTAESADTAARAHTAEEHPGHPDAPGGQEARRV